MNRDQYKTTLMEWYRNRQNHDETVVVVYTEMEESSSELTELLNRMWAVMDPLSSSAYPHRDRWCYWSCGMCFVAVCSPIGEQDES